MITILAVVIGLAIVGGGVWWWQAWRAMKADAVDTWRKIAQDANDGMSTAPASAPAPGLQAAVKAIEGRGGNVILDGSVAVFMFSPDRGTVDSDLALLEPFKDMDWSVVLAYAGVTDAGVKRLAGFPRVTRLSLLGCAQVTDEGVKALASLPKLEWLELSDTRVTPAGLASLRAALPKTVILPKQADQSAK
ncbi:MAG: hypothetical protein NTV86_02730 [Planctomycetota bacterium]|nr:hypothetical protein [Planctomycetota bacterium]